MSPRPRARQPQPFLPLRLALGGGTVLGIDPGIASCGYGVISGGRHVCHGVLTTEKAVEQVIADADVRIAELERDFLALLEQYKPGAVAIENFTFWGKGHEGTSVATADACKGVIHVFLSICRRATIPAVRITTQTAKRHVCGSPTASKEDVQAAVRVRLGLSRPVKWSHSADALAVAITYIERHKGRS